MSGVKAIVPLSPMELQYAWMFRIALSEPDHAARMQALELVRHDVTADELALVLASEDYRLQEDPPGYPFVKWVAETEAVRHEAIVAFQQVAQRYEKKNEQKLNVAEVVGSTIIEDIKAGTFRGVHPSGGIFEDVRDIAKAQKIHGARDKDVVRKLWKSYRGVVHFGMALSQLEENPDDGGTVLEWAELIRKALSENCPRGQKEPYVPPAEQTKFVLGSMLKGPRY